tara:strand:- start:92 stop:607 length:516 start_codon:yes stop_codon:yes gene_type:complete
MSKPALADRPYRPCVGITLMNRVGEVFVARRVDDPDGYWQMPQGGIDKGETAIEAALRELEEETGTNKAELLLEMADWVGYDLPADLADKVWKGRYRGQKQRWFCLLFTGEDSDIDINTAHPEFVEWRWMDLQEAVQEVIPFKRDIYRHVADAFAQTALNLRDGDVPHVRP